MPKPQDPAKQLATIAADVGTRAGNVRLPADVFIHLVNHASDPPEAMTTAAKAAEAGKQPVVITCDDFRSLHKSPATTGGGTGGGDTDKASGTPDNGGKSNTNRSK